MNEWIRYLPVGWTKKAQIKISALVGIDPEYNLPKYKMIFRTKEL